MECLAESDTTCSQEPTDKCAGEIIAATQINYTTQQMSC